MVLFCAEAVDWVTSGLFGKPWKKAEYVRTDCFRAAAASCAVPSAPSRVNAKAVLLGGVPWEEQWWASPVKLCWDDHERSERASALLPAALRLACPADQHQYPCVPCLAMCCESSVSSPLVRTSWREDVYGRSCVPAHSPSDPWAGASEACHLL